jgi:hypothetical protein
MSWAFEQTFVAPVLRLDLAGCNSAVSRLYGPAPMDESDPEGPGRPYDFDEHDGGWPIFSGLLPRKP